MKTWIAVDGADGEVSAHSKREEAEAEAIRRAGSGGTWADAPTYGWKVYSGPQRKVRVIERPISGDPAGE
jgi:hypothetical protein